MHTNKSLYVMESLRTYDVLQRNLQVLNQKEDRHLKKKLDMLEKQYRYTRKMLQQRRDSLIIEQRKLVMVKVCEPKATVNIAMKEIREHNDPVMYFRGIQTSDSRRLFSSKSQYHNKGPEPVEQSRSISAPPPPPPSVKPSSSVRHRGNTQSSLSFMQMKNIATIDSISEKEQARQRQRAREELERLRQFQMEALHNRVVAFIENLKDKRSLQLHVEPP